MAMILAPARSRARGRHDADLADDVARRADRADRHVGRQSCRQGDRRQARRRRDRTAMGGRRLQSRLCEPAARPRGTLADLDGRRRVVALGVAAFGARLGARRAAADAPQSRCSRASLGVALGMTFGSARRCASTALDLQIARSGRVASRANRAVAASVTFVVVIAAPRRRARSIRRDPLHHASRRPCARLKP